MSRLRLLIVLTLYHGAVCQMNEDMDTAHAKFKVVRRTVQNLNPVEAGTLDQDVIAESYIPSQNLYSGRKVKSSATQETTKAINLCYLSFDAAANIRGDLFFMKGARAWRITESLGLLPDENGLTMSQFWRGFPDIRVDAAFENPADGKIVFISGYHYWTFVADVQTRMVSSRRSTCDFGLCPEEEIRAAVMWGANDKIYLFGKSKFWRLSDTLKVEIGYPKNISVLKNVPHNLDAAVRGLDGGTYFLKGSRYWELDNEIIASSSDSAYIGAKWFGCNESMYEKETTTASPRNGVEGAIARRIPFNYSFICVGSLFIVIIAYSW